jgi:hypothetical protein
MSPWVPALISCGVHVAPVAGAAVLAAVLVAAELVDAPLAELLLVDDDELPQAVTVATSGTTRQTHARPMALRRAVVAVPAALAGLLKGVFTADPLSLTKVAGSPAS